LLINKFN